MKFLLYLLPVAILVGCAGCDDKTTSVVASNNGEQVAEEYVAPQASPEVYEQVRKDVKVYFDSMNDGDFEKHVDMAHPGIFRTDDERIYQIETMSDWYKKGLKNYARNIEVKHISEPVQLDTSLAHLVVIEGDFVVDFEDHFEGNRMTYDGQIKSVFVRLDMEWDSVNTQYVGHGKQLVYGITPENSLDFRFINERFVSTDRMGGIIDYENMKILKSYETLYPDW